MCKCRDQDVMRMLEEFFEIEDENAGVRCRDSFGKAKRLAHPAHRDDFALGEVLEAPLDGEPPPHAFEAKRGKRACFGRSVRTAENGRKIDFGCNPDCERAWGIKTREKLDRNFRNEACGFDKRACPGFVRAGPQFEEWRQISVALCFFADR